MQFVSTGDEIRANFYSSTPKLANHVFLELFGGLSFQMHARINTKKEK